MVNEIKEDRSNWLLTGRGKKENDKSLIARVKPNDVSIFNQLLKLFGFSGIDELVHDFIAGKLLHI
jgi:hypothetical protein